MSFINPNITNDSVRTSVLNVFGTLYTTVTLEHNNYAYRIQLKYDLRKKV